MTAINTNIENKILKAIPFCLTETNFAFGQKYRGKVRDHYDLQKALLMITTDRLSAFDQSITAIPFKGKILNLLSAWWFEKTKHIVPNHFHHLPDDNCMVVKKCRVFPVEIIVRAYLTGSTNTSLWINYKAGLREISGLKLPEGLIKNSPLPQLVITPTTKNKDHDAPISAKEIIEQKIMTPLEWQTVSDYALSLFSYGAQIAESKGLILVDTKYEFGIDENKQIVLVDEIHTSDSSRYWLQESYHQKMQLGQEPESFDKELIRLWLKNHFDPYKDKILPVIPQTLIVNLANRYIDLYKRLTEKSFDCIIENMEERLQRNLKDFFQSEVI